MSRSLWKRPRLRLRRNRRTSPRSSSSGDRRSSSEHAQLHTTRATRAGCLTGVGGASGPLGYTSGRGTNGAVINGAPVEDVTYLIDGINSVDTDAGVLIFFPPVDSIYEFKVQTSSAPAAYGGGQGIINVTYKSGNERVSRRCLRVPAQLRLWTRRTSSILPTTRFPPFKLNQFGFNLGGPVVIPKIFNGKDRLFFFADYEGKRVRQAQTFLRPFRLLHFGRGDFSACCPDCL